jgi:hypothetical protein
LLRRPVSARTGGVAAVCGAQPVVLRRVGQETGWLARPNGDRPMAKAMAKAMEQQQSGWQSVRMAKLCTFWTLC